MWGSDWPVTHVRGKCVSVGDSFFWLSPANADLAAAYTPGGTIKPLLVGVEGLRAVKVISLNRAAVHAGRPSLLPLFDVHSSCAMNIAGGVRDLRALRPPGARRDARQRAAPVRRVSDSADD